MKYTTYTVAIALVALVLVGAVSSLAPTSVAHAQGMRGGPGEGAGWRRGPEGGDMRWGDALFGVFGTISSVSGSTIVVEGRPRPAHGTSTVLQYTIDVSDATIYKDKATSTAASLSVGDQVMVRGTVNGTDVKATVVHDGVPDRQFGGRLGGRMMPQGNGEPVVGGTVTAIQGTSLTVTTASSIVYAVDAGTATVHKSGATSSVAAIAVGDSVVVQGRVDGTAVNASLIIDRGTQPTGRPEAQDTPWNGENRGSGLFRGISNFFSHIFGFFSK